MDYVLCLTDGGKPAMAFQAGALVELAKRGFLANCRVISGSGTGCFVLNMLAQCLADTREWSLWQQNTGCAAAPSDERKVRSVSGNDTDASMDGELPSVFDEVTLAVEEQSLLGDDRPPANDHPPAATKTRPTKESKRSEIRATGRDPSIHMQNFAMQMQTFCTQNQELGMFRRRLMSPTRWFANDYSDDLVGSLESSIDDLLSPGTIENKTDCNSPVLLWSGIQAAGSNRTEDRPQTELLVLTNDHDTPAHTQDLGMRFQSIHSRQGNVWRQTANMALPLKFTTVDSSVRSAARLDPYAYDAAHAYFLRLKLDRKQPKNGCLLMLDGFTGSPTYQTHDTASRKRWQDLQTSWQFAVKSSDDVPRAVAKLVFRLHAQNEAKDVHTKEAKDPKETKATISTKEFKRMDAKKMHATDDSSLTALSQASFADCFSRGRESCAPLDPRVFM